MGLDLNIKPDCKFRMLGSRDLFQAEACAYIANNVRAALEANGKAEIALSGGSTPKPVYEALSQVDMDWSKVRATLVDDRVTTDPLGSNATMVRDSLTQNHASALDFRALNADYFSTWSEFDLTIMGMGTDGHTASWFPGSMNLAETMNPMTEAKVLELDATGCPGAGQYAKRLTMTLPVVMNSQNILLLLTGDEKRQVFELAINKSVYDAPVKALLAAGSRLTVMWAP